MMKKLCALMLAMMLAVFAVPSIAELALPTGYTIEDHTIINTEAVNQLVAGMFGEGSEAMAGVIEKVAGLLNSLSFRLVVSGTGMQGEILLKDQPVANVAAQGSEKGFQVTTDLLPSFVMTIPAEMVQEYMNKMTSSMAGTEGLDVAALAEKYLTPMLETLTKSMGQPEAASYIFEDTSFTVKVPFSLTTREVLSFGLGFAKGVLSEKAVQDMAASFGVDLKDAAAKLTELEDQPEEELPVLAMALYSNEAGDMLYDVTVTKDEQAVAVQAGTVAGKTAVRVNAMDQVLVKVNVDTAAGVCNMEMNLNAQGMMIGLNADLMFADNMLNGSMTLAMNGLALLTEEFSAVPGGEVKAAIDTEGKTELRADALMNGISSETQEAISQEIMNGLMGLLQKAMEIMPDEINAIMMMLTPQQPATAE